MKSDRSHKYEGVGVHVFAGGFTMGVKEVMRVKTQLETHGPFGQASAEQVAGVEWINDPKADWPDVTADFAFGNPRCTGFSTITAGHDESTHGAWAKQTCDIHELCGYTAGRYPAIIWESVQGALTTGRELLDYLRDEIFAPRGYRIAHIKLNAASFGNAQQRKRYFFVAYDRMKNFNVVPPSISPYYPVMYDVIWNQRERKTHEMESVREGYDRDSYYSLTDQEKLCVPNLPNGWNLNLMGRHAWHNLPRPLQRVWDTRTSDMPFSMHCPFRTNWLRPAPTLHSSCCRFIHPDHHRPLTVGELSMIMGWGDRIPAGPLPAAQLAKGVIPSAGKWLAEQVEMFLDDAWGGEDWESSYDPKTGTWTGRDTHGELEKTFDLTQYCGHQFDTDRYPGLERSQKHRHNIGPDGRIVRPWRELATQWKHHKGGTEFGDMVFPGRTDDDV